MPVIRVNDKPYALKPGQTLLGSGPDADIGVPVAEPGIQAVLTLGGNSATLIRRAREESVVKVNGVMLGAEPTPLMHGDKVEIGGVELFFSEDRKSGATQYVSTSDVSAMAAAKRAGPARATTATGGRLVSLVDGKEYTIPDQGIVIGRDASSQVVVAQSEVSRHHARISPAQNGYLLVDQSTNGVFVNGERVSGSQVLARSDVVRVGSEEFRFYADVAPVVRAAVAPAAPAAAAPPPAPVEAPRPAPPPLSSEPATLPTARDARPVLATLEMRNEGADKGKQIEIRDPLVHIGRGSHNDVPLSDESVSDSHAKLQCRDDGWYVVDMDSTNGTYAGGKRVEGERKLVGSPDLRFGGVRMTFRPVSEVAGAKGTRVFVTPGALKAEPAPASRGISLWLWVVLALLLIGAAVFFLTR